MTRNVISYLEFILAPASQCRQIYLFRTPLFFSELGGSFTVFVPQRNSLISLPMPILSSSWRTHCLALIPLGRFLTFTRYAVLKNEQATLRASACLSATSFERICQTDINSSLAIRTMARERPSFGSSRASSFFQYG